MITWWERSPPGCGPDRLPDRCGPHVLRYIAALLAGSGRLSRRCSGLATSGTFINISGESAFSDVLRNHPNGTSLSPTCGRRQRAGPVHAVPCGQGSGTRPVAAGGQRDRSGRDHHPCRVSAGQWHLRRARDAPAAQFGRVRVSGRPWPVPVLPGLGGVPGRRRSRRPGRPGRPESGLL